MKKSIQNVFGAIALLVAIFFAAIPFLASFVSALALRRTWIAYTGGFAFTIAITIYSAAFPEIFRFGGIDLRIHDGLYIAGIPALVANVLKNLFFAYLGVLSGLAVRESWKNTRSNKTPQGKRDIAVL